MRVGHRLQQTHTPWTLVVLFGVVLTVPGCLPGERSNDTLPDVKVDTTKTDATKTDSKGDGATADGSLDAAADGTGTDEDIQTPDDVQPLGCKTDGDCAALVVLPCHATATCAPTTGLCASAQLDVDTACVSDLCVVGQKCDDTGTCAGGTPKDCSDGNGCTLDLCGSGTCSHPFADLACSDGDQCTISDHCESGVCKGTTLDCNDFDPCTNDSCNPTGDASASVLNLCQNIGFPYAPSTPIACTGNAPGDLPFCHQGSCGVPKDCDDKNPCTDDSPNPVTGACDHVFLGNVTCGNDKCNPGTCTQDDKGIATCVTKPKCTTTKVCMTVACDANTGTCGSPTPQPKGTVCGDECTANGTCDGASKPKCSGTPVVCNDGNICTDETCYVGLGCTPTANTKPCTDGNGCTTGDVCANGACGGTAVPTDDGNACTVDACNPIDGVTHKPETDGTDCGNNSACSQGICKAK